MILIFICGSEQCSKKCEQRLHNYLIVTMMRHQQAFLGFPGNMLKKVSLRINTEHLAVLYLKYENMTQHRHIISLTLNFNFNCPAKWNLSNSKYLLK